MLRATRLTVHQATAGGQTPWHASASATPPFAYPVGATAQQIQAAAAGLPITPAALSSLPADVAYWAAIWRNTAEDDKAYLDAFGASAAADQAERVRMLLALLSEPNPTCAARAAGASRPVTVIGGVYCPRRLRRLLPAAGGLHRLELPAAAAAALRSLALGLRAAAAAAVVRSVASGLPRSTIRSACHGIRVAQCRRRFACRGIRVAQFTRSCIPWHPGCPGGPGTVVHSVASGLPWRPASVLRALASGLPRRAGSELRPVASGLPRWAASILCALASECTRAGRF